MSDDIDWDEVGDDELMALLAEAVAESDAVTDRRREGALAAFAWRTVDEELAELLHDSALDAGAAVRSSAPDGPRSLSFGSGDLSLEVEVDGTTVMGQVVPPTVATVAVQHFGQQAVSVETDASGLFRLEGVQPGTVRFVARAADWTLTSPWIVV